MNILLVEDDPRIARFVTRGLAQHGYGVAWEHGAARVPMLLAGGTFVAALIDVGLPDGDGIALCAALRRDGIDTPVLMLTARGALQDRLDGFAAGADDYLAKPFAFEELVARVSVLVRRGVASPASLVRWNRLTLDPVRRTAVAGDTALALSDREFDLLARLTAAAGRIVSRADLLESVWHGQPVSDNALDVYIGYLRRRLTGVREAPGIETLRGRGFRLVPRCDAT